MIALWGLGLVAVLWLTHRVVSLSPGAKKDQKHIPGPPGKFLVGNLFDIPPYHSWLKFKQWADQYGPLFQLHIGARRHVIISTEKIANDLLRERGTFYSSREYLPMASGLVSHNMRSLLLPYNELWRRNRKLAHQLTMPAAAESYQDVQDYESKKMLLSLIESPHRYEKWFKRYASGVVFRIGFGKWVETGEEPEVKRILQVVHNVEKVASPGAYLVDTLPILNILPEAIAGFKKEGRKLHEEELSLFRQLQNDVRTEIAKGSKAQSFTRTFLENQDSYQLTDDEGAYAIGVMFEAGSGTTSAAMMSFCLAMCHFPEWQKKMQDELDRHVGERIPEFSDMPNLPTVRAVIKEVMRWRPVTAGGFPHKLTKDDEYDGYQFEEGTIFHPNQWAIHRDPVLYPDPDAFRPERWLDPKFETTYKEPLSKFPNLQNYSCFGFGRRICPGQNIAERSLNIMVARIAWACNLAKKRDESGNEISLPLYDYTKGFNTQPNYFGFDLVARSPERYEAVKVALEKSKASRGT